MPPFAAYGNRYPDTQRECCEPVAERAVTGETASGEMLQRGKRFSSPKWKYIDTVCAAGRGALRSKMVDPRDVLNWGAAPREAVPGKVASASPSGLQKCKRRTLLRRFQEETDVRACLVVKTALRMPDTAWEYELAEDMSVREASTHGGHLACTLRRRSTMHESSGLHCAACPRRAPLRCQALRPRRTGSTVDRATALGSNAAW
ncbi:hypothetical protein FB451DRAFT_1168496 [Mycena latifolia]|nr:hypothetical protein FB451DRAFT_1168496 [Mycena latifolia]